MYEKIFFNHFDSLVGSFDRKYTNYKNDIKPVTLLKNEEDGSQVYAYNVLGMSKEDVKVELISKGEKVLLKITGEKVDKYGLSFNTNLQAPISRRVDTDKIDLKVKNGVLYIILRPKEEFKEFQKELEIK